MMGLAAGNIGHIGDSIAVGFPLAVHPCPIRRGVLPAKTDESASEAHVYFASCLSMKSAMIWLASMDSGREASYQNA
jgi:hypothetical protein